MNKRIVIGAAATCLAACGIAAAANKGREHAPKQTGWEKMKEKMDEMPADFPPRVMYDNIEATKANTERILDLLETDEKVAGVS